MSIPILSIIGKSGSGKTTLLEKLIPEIKRRGYRVATIKHHAHPGFEIDQPGKDTWRHSQAGSDVVIIAAPDKVAMIRNLEHELSLDEIAAGISEVDIILTEGYKRAGKPAIEVINRARGSEQVGDIDQVIVVACDPLAADDFLEANIPVFDWDDAVGIVDFVQGKFLA